MTTFLFIRACPPMTTVTDTNEKPKSRNLSVNWYDTNIREKELQMEQFIRNFVSPKLTIRFHRDGGSIFTDRNWVNFIWKGRNKTRFQHRRNPCSKLLYFRAVQGHTGGEMIPPEMLGHSLIPPNWKEFVFHRRCSIQFAIHFECEKVVNSHL